MMERGFGVAEGVSPALMWTLAGLLALGLVLLLLEARARKVTILIGISGLVAAILVAAAVLRPTRVTSRGTDLFPKVVVLLDRSMPGGPGESFVPAIRELAPHARIIFLSGGTVDGKLAAMVDAVVPKPVTGPALLNAIHQVFEANAVRH